MIRLPGMNVNSGAKRPEGKGEGGLGATAMATREGEK